MNIKTLAKLCGVSVSTVSRAINGHPDVSEEVRRKVLETAQQVHYIPNDAARDLVSRPSDAIGLVVKGIGNIFFTAVIRAIEKTAEELGYTLVLHQINTDESELLAGATLARSKRLKGLVLLGGKCDYTAADTELLGVPFVCCTYRNNFGALEDAAYSSVTVDDTATAFAATDYLLRSGHKKIAILLPDRQDGSIGALRFEGYKRALTEAGLQPEETLIAETASYSLHGAYNATRRLVASGTAFTAMFAAADTMAVAAIRALYDAGVRVPQDCSVIAIDGISVTQYTIPALTTMVQPAEELGRGAVTTLIDLIDGRSGNRHITLEAVLREGESVRDVR